MSHRKLAYLTISWKDKDLPKFLLYLDTMLFSTHSFAELIIFKTCNSPVKFRLMNVSKEGNSIFRSVAAILNFR